VNACMIGYQRGDAVCDFEVCSGWFP
jgi:hypothetical protein